MNHRILWRFAWLLLCLGVAGSMMSLATPHLRLNIGGNVYPDEYKGRVCFLAGDIKSEITVNDENRISFYIYDWNNSMYISDTHSIESASPIFVLQNVTQYEGIITIPTVGYYTLFTTCLGNETVSFRNEITWIVPQRHIVYPSFVITVIGLILMPAIRVREQLVIGRHG